jgi:kumamolisin
MRCRLLSRDSICRILKLIFLMVGLGSGSVYVASGAMSVPTDAVGESSSLLVNQNAAAPAAVHLTFALKSSSLATADDFVTSLTDPKSPNYHRWLTPAQFGSRFGASSSDINAVASYLSSNGFTGIRIWPNHLFVSAISSTSNVRQVFGTSIRGYARDLTQVAKGYSSSFYAPEKEPLVDTLIAGKLAGVFGLSNIGQHMPESLVRAPEGLSSNQPLSPAALSDVYNGAALHTAGFTGSGITIAIFSPTTYNTSDINAFLNANGISGANISVVNVNGGTRDASNEVEACLDIETVVGQAPGATIKVYEGPNDGSLDVFNQMATDDPAIVTESYGSDETSVSSAFAASYETLRKQMAAEGISIIVASGDNGAYDSVNQTTVTTSVDATSAYVTSIGGTELNSFQNNTYNGEIAWSYNDGTLGANTGSGGGLSIYYPQPSWQTGPGVDNSKSNGMRQTPDISSLASSPYYNIYAQGSFSGYGGTSAACQFFGGSLALIEQEQKTRLGNIDPALYSYGNTNPAIYHDIISGSNGVYSCNPHWDYVTGWGSLNIAQLALAVQGTNTSSTPIYAFPAGLQMFSVPYVFNLSDTAGELLNGLTTMSGYPAYIIAAWQPTTMSYAISPNSAAMQPAPGRGFWARFGSTATLTAVGSTINSSTYSVPLSVGWNMIGDPYTSPISISSLTIGTSAGTLGFGSAAAAGLVQPSIYDYNGSVYIAHGQGDTINPFDGYWIYSYVKSTLIYSAP